MRFDTTIDLLELEETTGDNGFPQTSVKSRKTVYAKRGSIRSSEFYLAAQSGFSLELMFVVFTLEYASQKYIEYQTKRYKIIRTYEKEKYTELICQAYQESP
ncbi:phage head closure protein [Bacillus sp. ISL-40]|uniref:phage head closure protein n=1 Tax=unclassified Bacillus (in: firmicutes) TaxID=185979 RepID=UPI001BE903B8|nr:MULTISPECIES: phage head closure protein [unclassified Bacillus (in: firmicutes)]MBT2696348.1 phage head closure protein [Bacillus sp. ISL-40]MBT2743197.1 phage head closure protein [Bacillus sp. ISL-77]